MKTLLLLAISFIIRNPRIVINFLLKNRVITILLACLLPIIVIGPLPLPPLLKILILLTTGCSIYFFIKQRSNNSKIQNSSDEKTSTIEGSYRVKDDKE